MLTMISVDEGLLTSFRNTAVAFQSIFNPFNHFVSGVRYTSTVKLYLC